MTYNVFILMINRFKEVDCISEEYGDEAWWCDQ